jgi:hydrogenase nickel incorporation protein HypB
MSVTEGEDKPLKYPTIFHSTDLVVLTKVGLADAVDFDRDAAVQNIQHIRADLPILETSSRGGAGLTDWYAWLANAQSYSVKPRGVAAP